MPFRLPLLLVTLVLAAGRVQAQPTTALVVEPSEVAVTVPQGEEVVQAVTLTNTGSEALSFCLNFERPLQRQGSALRLSEEASGAACGEYGEVLYRFDEEDFGGGWSPYGIVMTPEGRLFTAELGGFPWRTFEFAPDLQLLRFFEHPHVAELTPFSSTSGIAFDPESGTLWWMNAERTSVNGQIVTRRILLLEGDFTGEPTGRQVQLVLPDGMLEPMISGGLAYDVATDRFYFSAKHGNGSYPENWRLWAVDREGSAPEGYPLRPEPYLNGLMGPLDAHGGAEGGAEGVRIEYGAYPPFQPGRDRIVVVDRWGNSEGEALETPVPAALFEGWGAGIRGNPLRSRIDPNGVMYMTFTNFEHTGIVGVRPHPLPPSWLVVDSDEGTEAAWDGTLEPGESREVVLTFRSDARGIGTYTSALQTFDAATGEAVEVPLTLQVTQGTPAEETPAAGGAAVAWQLLAPYPNPSEGSVTVPLEVERMAEVRVSVLDVLGREVALLHEGLLPAGEHRLTLRERLPAGLYVVRAAGRGLHAAQRIVVQ